jgi:hypothetical protein
MFVAAIAPERVAILACVELSEPERILTLVLSLLKLQINVVILDSLILRRS